MLLRKVQPRGVIAIPMHLVSMVKGNTHGDGRSNTQWVCPAVRARGPARGRLASVRRGRSGKIGENYSLIWYVHLGYSLVFLPEQFSEVFSSSSFHSRLFFFSFFLFEIYFFNFRKLIDKEKHEGSMFIINFMLKGII